MGTTALVLGARYNFASVVSLLLSAGNLAGQQAIQAADIAGKEKHADVQVRVQCWDSGKG